MIYLILSNIRITNSSSKVPSLGSHGFGSNLEWTHTPSALFAPSILEYFGSHRHRAGPIYIYNYILSYSQNWNGPPIRQGSRLNSPCHRPQGNTERSPGRSHSKLFSFQQKGCGSAVAGKFRPMHSKKSMRSWGLNKKPTRLCLKMGYTHQIIMLLSELQWLSPSNLVTFPQETCSDKPILGQNPKTNISSVYIYILYYIILSFIILYYIKLYYTILYYMIIYYIILYYTILYCIILYYILNYIIYDIILYIKVYYNIFLYIILYIIYNIIIIYYIFKIIYSIVLYYIILYYIIL